MPRTKTTPQMLAELDAIYALGYRGHVDFVDDNFIGKASSSSSRRSSPGRRSTVFPFELSTEASVNMADDDDLLAMMRAANFFTVFVGIESPDSDTLIATQKKQNIKHDLADRIGKIYAAGCCRFAIAS